METCKRRGILRHCTWWLDEREIHQGQFPKAEKVHNTTGYTYQTTYNNVYADHLYVHSDQYVIVKICYLKWMQDFKFIAVMKNMRKFFNTKN